jgi:hypothetical protein
LTNQLSTNATTATVKSSDGTVVYDVLRFTRFDSRTRTTSLLIYLPGMFFNPLSTVVHRAKRALLHAKAPSEGVQKHSLPSSPYGLFGWQRVNPLRTVGHRAKRALLHAKAPSEGVQKHSLPSSPYGLFGWLRVNPSRTVGPPTQSSIRGCTKT